MRNGMTIGARETTAADVVVVGGGVIGLAVARALAKRRVRVTLIERGELGMESSRAAGGMLAPQAEADRADAFFELACASREMYPAFADSLREETGIDVELERTGTLYLAFTEADERAIAHRYHWQKNASLMVERLTSEEARMLEPCIAPHVRAALRFPLDVQIENRQLVKALAASIEKLGVRLLTHTEVEALRIERGRVEGVETSRGFVAASAVVIAGGAWSSLIEARSNTSSCEIFSIQIKPVRGQMLCFKAEQTIARHILYSPRGYLVPRRDQRVLAGSTTEDVGFDKRVTQEGTRAIMAHAIEIAPIALDRLQLIDAWAGLRPRAEDEHPVIGAAIDVGNLFYATGHYRNGILLAPITGELIADLITEKVTPPELRAFSPARFHVAGVNAV